MQRSYRQNRPRIHGKRTFSGGYGHYLARPVASHALRAGAAGL